MDLALTDNININLKVNSTTYEVRKVIVNQNGSSYVAYEKIDYSQEYFTIESLENGNTIYFTKGSSAVSRTFYYSLNNGTSWTSANATKSWSLNKGDKLMIRAQVNYWSNGTNTNNAWIFSSTKEYKVYGNIMSLLYGYNFKTQTSLPNYSYCIASLFRNSTHLTDVSNLIFPATTLRNYCYYSMFKNNAFSTAPVLPAATLAANCYEELFYGCSSLNYVKCLATDRSASNCIKNWMTLVASSGTFVKSSSTTWSTGIPNTWTVQNA